MGQGSDRGKWTQDNGEGPANNNKLNLHMTVYDVQCPEYSLKEDKDDDNIGYQVRGTKGDGDGGCGGEMKRGQKEEKWKKGTKKKRKRNEIERTDLISSPLDHISEAIVQAKLSACPKRSR